MLTTVFTVNSLADNTALDDRLTLPEALDIADSGNFNVDHVLTRAENAQISFYPDVYNRCTIQFDPSLTAGGPATINLSLIGDSSAGNSSLVVKGPLTIEGPAGHYGITLAGPGGGNLRLFLVTSSSDLTLENLTLTHGSTGGMGGAIYLQGGSTAELTNTTLSDNSAGTGGAVYVEGGGVTFTNSTLSANSATQAAPFITITARLR